MTIADEINGHLTDGGVVIMSTYTQARQYESKHAGMFFMGDDGELYVKHGRGKECLTSGGRLLVSLKAYKEAL